MTVARILSTHPLHPSAQTELKNYELDVMADVSSDAWRSQIRSAHVLVVLSGAPLPADLLYDTPELLGIVRCGAGVDVIPLEVAREKAIPVANTPGGNARAVAEHAVVMIGMLQLRIPLITQAFREVGWMAGVDWARNRYDLSGRRLGIVGMGAIGRRVAQICHDGFGMEVICHHPRAEGLPDFARLQGLDEVFSNSDVVVLCCPLNEMTQGLCNSERLHKMKPSALLINVGRGGLLVESDLLEAVQSGRIAGAAVDVFDGEPVGRDHPFVQEDRIIALPHVAAISTESFETNSLTAARQVIEILSDQPPRHLIYPDSWISGAGRRRAILDKLATI